MPVIVYQGQDEKRIVIARGLLGRHLTDDQRLAFVIAAELDDLRAKAQKRIVKARRKMASLRRAPMPRYAGEGMAFVKPQKPIHVHKEIAKKAGVGESKAHAAIAATDRDPEVLKEIKEGKKRWRDVPKPKPFERDEEPVERRPKKEPPFEDQAYKKWSAWLNKFGSQKQRVMELVYGWIKPDVENQKGGAK